MVSQKKNTLAKQKFRPTRRSGFSGAKAYLWYVEILKNYCNAGGRTFCDAIKASGGRQAAGPLKGIQTTASRSAGLPLFIVSSTT